MGKTKKKASRKKNLATGTLPKAGKNALEAVYASLVSDGWKPPKAAQVAWSVAKQSYKKDKSGTWKKRAKKLPKSSTRRRGHKGRRGNGGASWPYGSELAKGPMPHEGFEVEQLGEVLEVESEGKVVRSNRGTPLLWSPKHKALLWVEGGRKSSKRPATRSSASFEAFNGRAPNVEYQIEGPTSGKWYRVGAADRTDYWSDKFGKSDEYTHDHGSMRPSLYCYGTASGPKLWCIRGGKLRITERGIEG